MGVHDRNTFESSLELQDIVSFHIKIFFHENLQRFRVNTVCLDFCKKKDTNKQ